MVAEDAVEWSRSGARTGRLRSMNCDTNNGDDRRNPENINNNDTSNAHNNQHNNKRNRNNDGRANESNQNNQDDAPVGPATYVYGMNEELLLGLRAKVETPDDKELPLPLNEIWEDGKAPDDTILVVAQWYDNHNAEIPGLTWGRLRKMQADRQSSSPAFGNILEGTQKLES